VVVGGFGDEADRVGLGGKERGKARIVRRRTAGPAVMPNAVTFALSGRRSANKLVSIGLAPG